VEEEEKKEVNIYIYEGALLDEIRNENPMARLKKLPTGNNENTSIDLNNKDTNVSNVKKEPPKAPAANPVKLGFNKA
jgi:hypothetical protein